MLPKFFVTLLCFASAATSIRITDFAVPKALPVGENAELQCRYEVGPDERGGVLVKWWWRAPGADAARILYQRIADNPPSAAHGHIEIRGNDTLLLKDLQPENSGEYECEVSLGIDESRQKETLSIYTEGSGPSVNVTDADEDGNILVTCEASDVAPKPELVITVDGKVVNLTESVSETSAGHFNISARAETAAGAGAELRCELFYEDEAISHPAYVDVITLEDLTGADAENATSTEGEMEITTELAELRESETDGASCYASPVALLLLTSAALLWL